MKTPLDNVESSDEDLDEEVVTYLELQPLLLEILTTVLEAETLNFSEFRTIANQLYPQHPYQFFERFDRDFIFLKEWIASGVESDNLISDEIEEIDLFEYFGKDSEKVLKHFTPAQLKQAMTNNDFAERVTHQSRRFSP